LAELDQLIIDVVDQDYPVSLRGVYYRVVSAGGADKTETAYRAVGRRLLELRRSGLIPYDRISDGTRWMVRPRSHDDLEDALTQTAALYRRNMWRDQDVEVHVFTEKDAITGVIEPITKQWNVPLGVIRGYCSETFAHSMAQAIMASSTPAFVYQLGDHDPSGVGAWTDFQRKVAGFIPSAEVHFDDSGERDWRDVFEYKLGMFTADADADVTFERLAATPEQIIGLDLPTRPTKASDTRARNFVGGSVEVDAIPAPILRDIVRDAIEQLIDPDALNRIEIAEESERSLLFDLAGREWSS
jgi:hypothetical protein